MIYLDYASHTPADAAAVAEFCRVEAEFIANPRAAHTAGAAARAELERVRTATARLLGANPEGLHYTSGATEANAIAINTHAHEGRHTGKHIITTALEHPSVSSPLAALREQGHEVELTEIKSDGTVDLESLAALLRRETVLLCVSWVDSELGAVQPIADIAALLEKFPNCRLHVDAAQAVGKIPVSFEGIDSMSVSPHKFHGLCGCGFLFSSKRFELNAHNGTPSLALAASSLTALENTLKKPSIDPKIREILESYPKVRINSPKNASPFILNLSVEGVKGTDFQAALDRRGVCVSVKSACAAQGTPSRAVLAVSRDRKNALSSWRVSFSHDTQQEDIDGFLAAFDECYKELTC